MKIDVDTEKKLFSIDGCMISFDLLKTLVNDTGRWFKIHRQENQIIVAVHAPKGELDASN